MTHELDLDPQASQPTQPSLPLDRVVGWVLFFAVMALTIAAFVVKPGTGGIDDVAARDVGGPFGAITAGDTSGTGETAASDDDTSASQANDSEANDTEATADASNDQAESGAPPDETNGADETNGGAATGPTTITLAFTGDVLVHESVAESARTDTGFDFSPQFADVAPVLANASLALCHLETPISTDNSTLAYYPTFLVPSQVADGIASAGVDGCSVSSNHALDAGEAGLASTTNELERVMLGYSGVAGPSDSRGRLTTYSLGVATIGHLSYTYGFNGLEPTGRNAELANVLDLATIAEDAAIARSNGANFVVVSAHWGDEFSVGLSDYQADLGPKIAAITDVDLVIGHHAHVVQQVSKIGEKYVAYGLGNFLSNQGPDPDSCPSCPPESQDGVILLVDVDIASGTPVATGVRAVPTWVDRANGHVVRVLTSGDSGERADSFNRTKSALNGDGVDVALVAG